MPQFKTALKKSDFQEGKLMKSEIGGKSIVIGMVEDFSLPKAPHQFEIGFIVLDFFFEPSLL